MEFNLTNFIATIGLILISICTTTADSLWPDFTTERCSGGGKLKYLSGDALTDNVGCIGPNGLPYPSSTISRAFGGSARKGRQSNFPSTLDPMVMQSTLLSAYREANDEPSMSRAGRSLNSAQTPQCGSSPSRLCKTRYNTTAPMYGVSLTSGQPVTIVQKFPDLLQQVVFEVCESSECDVVRGDCVQTYVPYLFLVIPLGPVTLTGQDYILVESGCVCKPRAAKHSSSSSPHVIDILP
ncbi:hypothetical protein PVAND_007946 [Polypedilum vanderplanki]|uniref:Spaetzle domain-containing protein n=1 Tax=Polypedilum vanderplanki TaxID=319348 RepID=A0A9J6C9D8_POLVA|nr:hypothetical protein PVAND_007946 [Polypedilum vanderplanki]